LTDRCLIYRNVAQERNFPCRRTAATRGRRSPSRVGGGAHRAAWGHNALRRVYDVVLAWERGAWDEVSLAAARLGLRSEEIAARYKSALEFGNSVALVEGGRPARV